MPCSSRSLASSDVHPFASRIDDIAELTAIRGPLTCCLQLRLVYIPFFFFLRAPYLS
jgi:hypothetical protein